jgi:hypothetical protein
MVSHSEQFASSKPYLRPSAMARYQRDIDYVGSGF